VRIDQCNSIRDFRLMARRRLPGPIFHYIDGAAGDEVTYRRNTEAYDTRLSSTRRRGSRSPTTFPNTQRVSPARTHHTIPDRPIAAIPIARVAEGVQNHKQA
jgi:hypothetical protein